jgi:hypothetical protein
LQEIRTLGNCSADLSPKNNEGSPRASHSPESPPGDPSAEQNYTPDANEPGSVGKTIAGLKCYLFAMMATDEGTRQQFRFCRIHDGEKRL